MITLPDVAFLHRLCDLADAETLPRFRTGLAVDAKATPGLDFDPVTEADRRAEAAIRAEIERVHPDHRIVGEEYGTSGDGRCAWVLDPVDGTRPFLCGLPVWGTLVGFTVDGVARLGMMSQPHVGERFWADDDGAWVRSAGTTRRLSTRATADLGGAILHTTSPHGFVGEGREGLDRLIGATRMIRYGGECYATAMLAAGLIDLCLEPSLQPYDIVALVPIVERAGGVVTRLDGGRPEAGGAVLASSGPRLHEAALHLLAGA